MYKDLLLVLVMKVFVDHDFSTINVEFENRFVQKVIYSNSGIYTFIKDGIKQYVLFGPDLSKFKQFNDGQELADYATANNLIGSSISDDLVTEDAINTLTTEDGNTIIEEDQ
jgi:hypothetical protein